MAPSPLSPREEALAVWTGAKVLLWGGYEGWGPSGQFAADAALYDPRRDEWTLVAEGPIARTYGSTLIWTGTEAIVWGGFRPYPTQNAPAGTLADGAAYNPALGSWRELPAAPLHARTGHVAAWTGTEMIIWGGAEWEGQGFNDGAAFDPAKNAWRTISAPPLSSASDAAAVWTGHELAVIVGEEAAAYRPADDTWRALPPLPPPSTEHFPIYRAVWTGQAMIVVGGCCPPGKATHDVYVLEPPAGQWRTLPSPPVPENAFDLGLGWTTSELVVWAGRQGFDGTEVSLSDAAGGSVADLASPEWQSVTDAPITPRGGFASVWIGDALVIWGGTAIGARSADGAILRP